MHLVISMINVRPKSGPFTVFRQFCEAASELEGVQTTVLCHSLDDVREIQTQNVTFLEYPLSQKCWLIRVYYEYVYFYFLAKRLQPDYWLSLHDITPNIGKICPQSVYCHNPSPFYHPRLIDLYFCPSLVLFSFFYRYLYRINIGFNQDVIVQQEWLRRKFNSFYKIKETLVALPLEADQVNLKRDSNPVNGRFIYASRGRPFKNFDVICKAATILHRKGFRGIEFILTIDQTENRYTKYITKKYGKCPLLKFVGCLDKKTLYDYYASSDAMIFPSKLETWGLGITEFKSFNRPIFIADLEYAHETLGEYSKSIVFTPDDPQDLADKISGYLNGAVQPTYHPKTIFEQPFVTSTSDTIKFLLYKVKSPSIP